MIYLNVAGLAPFHKAVQQEVSCTLEQFSHLLYSEEGIHFYRETIRRCRKDIAQWLHVENSEHVVFVPNATTASWLVLSRIHWKPDDQILTTTHENSTVLREIMGLQTQGVQVHRLDPTSPTELENEIEHRLLSKHVRAIVISHVSHIDGRIFPIERITKLAQTHDTFLIVDGAQAVGHIPINFESWQPDAYFFPGHKWCAGPMGTGALILKKRFTKHEALGHDKKKYESAQPLLADFELGTQNIGLIVGLAKACLIKQQDGLKTDRLEHTREEVQKKLSEMSQIEILGWKGPHCPGILSFCCLNKRTEVQLQSKSEEIIWKTFPIPKNRLQKGIRLSWSSNTTKTEVEFLLNLLQNTP